VRPALRQSAAPRRYFERHAERSLSFGTVRLSVFELALCAASLSVSVSTAEPAVTGTALVRIDPEIARGRHDWDRHSLWAKGERGASAPHVDADGDGIDDDAELALAKAYFPYYSLDSREDCSLHGVLFRLTPHPRDKTKFAIWYVVLYERDGGRYGMGSHVGDDETFSALVDPSVAPPAGILALRAISHQNTILERKTTCGSINGCTRCDTTNLAGELYPVVFVSASKHGQYVSELACDTWPNDFGACSLRKAPDEAPFVNAGEPVSPLCRDLTTNGFITPGNGWSEPSLLHFDPWANHKFGRAGNVTEDLVDPAFLIDPSGC
jgi:hypothetical protein